MKTLCQYENGKCSQCGRSQPKGARTCDAWKALQPDYVPPVEKPPAEPVPPCKFLGELTGNMRKRCCNCTPDIPEHFCLAPQRMVKKRNGELVSGRCTPTDTCHDKSVGIQDCARCPLHAIMTP